MKNQGNRLPLAGACVEDGGQVMIDGQPHACIRNVNAMRSFLMSVVSNGDPWLFIGSNTSFTAGRVNPSRALFPYQTVDKLLRHSDAGGALTVFQVDGAGGRALWEPWRGEVRSHAVTRNLYKHVWGTDVVFEEINHDLGLRFTWSITTSETYGFVRHCRLENTGVKALRCVIWTACIKSCLPE